MASVYFHIPFCRKACHYCDFHFSTVRSSQSEMVACLLMEWNRVCGFLHGERVNSIYFGGGTPSLLSPGEIKGLIDEVYKRIPVRDEAEITLEVNPDDVSPDYLVNIRAAGVNRLSLGIQSLNDEILRSMNRAHDSRMALNSILWAREAGFNNLSVDLMFGVPRLSDVEWVNELQYMAEIGIPHISAYGLTLEPGTAWHRQVEKKKLIVPGDDVGRNHYQILMDFAQKFGYRHYEVSNLARAGMESKHNSAYWMGENYIGVGPSAHSYIDGIRWFNVSNNTRYIREIRAGELPQTREVLTPANRHNEYVLTRLRMDIGMDLAEYELKFGEAFVNTFRRSLSQINPQWIESDGSRLRLSPEGRFFTDGICASLFACE